MERYITYLIRNIGSWLRFLLLLLRRQNNNHAFNNRPLIIRFKSSSRRPPKPEWVKQEVIRLKALMPREGCRKVAHTFNHLHGEKRKMTVGKSYVYNVIKQHRYDIQFLRKKIKHQRPKPLPKNLIWSMDLTQLRDSSNRAHSLFGIIDGGTRACITLRAIPNKASITLLRVLLDAVENYGKPTIIRTDNEAVFISRLFRLGLLLLGIQQQRTEKCCPWMNGKIERLFGILKDKLQYHVVESAASLTKDVAAFRCWYNHIRPHQHLDGRTPAEVWSRRAPNQNGNARYFNAWDDALTGFYIPSG